MAIPTEVKPPLHGWNYEDWINDIEDSDDEMSEEPNLHPVTPFTRLLENLEATSFNFPIHATAEPGALLQMFPVYEEEDIALTWDHSTSPQELVPTVEMDTADKNLHDALQPRPLYPDTDLEDFSLTSSDSQDDVFDDPSIMEVSIGGTRRFKRSGAMRIKINEGRGRAEDKEVNQVTDEEDMVADEDEEENVVDREGGLAEVTGDTESLEDEAEANKSNAFPQQIPPTPTRRRSTYRVDYAHLHKHGRKRL